MNPRKTLPAIPLDDILQFIRSYRALEQMPLEDGFAHLRAITPAVLGEAETDLEQLRQHFRNQWYTKERHFGLFYLNLSHFRQIYLLHLWNIQDWQDEEYLGTALRNPFFRVAGRPPAKALQLHQLVKYFENHGVTYWPHSSTLLDHLPQEDGKRYGNSANWPVRPLGLWAGNIPRFGSLPVVNQRGLPYRAAEESDLCDERSAVAVRSLSVLTCLRLG